MSPSSRNAPLLTLFLVLFVVSVGFGIIIPTLPLLARSYGASGAMLGMMTSGYAVVQFLFAPLWGQLSDRVGRKPILMIGATGMTLSFLFMGLAESFWTLFAARVLGGFLGSATMPAAQALAAELGGGAGRARALGLMGAAFGTGFIFGPLIGGLLAPLGASTPFFAASAMGLVTLVLAVKVLREPARHAADVPDARPAAPSGFPSGAPRGFTLTMMRLALTGPGRPYYLLAFVIMLGQSSLMTALSLSLTDRFGAGNDTIGLVFAVNGAVGAMLQGLAIGRITDRLGEHRTIIAGLTIGLCAYAGIVAAPAFALAAGATVLTAVSLSLTRPSATSLLSKVTDLPQGITMGIQSSFDSLGRVVGPLWAGFAYDVHGALPFLSAAAAFGGMLVYLRSVGRTTGADHPALTPPVSDSPRTRPSLPEGPRVPARPGWRS